MPSGIDFRLDHAGIISICKSLAVRAQLESCAASKAREANARMHHSMPGTAGHDGYKASKAKGIRGTAIATVYTASRAAAKDHERHQTLNAINH